MKLNDFFTTNEDLRSDGIAYINLDDIQIRVVAYTKEDQDKYAQFYKDLLEFVRGYRV